MTNPSPFTGEGGTRPRSGWEGQGLLPSRKELLVRAKSMRANPTEAEKRIWSMLRDRRLASFKFRRQQVLDFYIVDFISISERLIIEADGSQHAESEDDTRRDGYLREQGFRLLRFWNNQVLGEPEAVKSAIFAALNFPHPPKPAAWAPPSPVKGEVLGVANG
jgi:very-short-patch-repair endonuclease